MEVTQVIVAYRNPLEMWLWESGAILFLVPVFLVAFLFVFYSMWKKMR